MSKPKILLVNKNKQTGSPRTHGYNAYDFDDQPDKYARASIFGKVVRSKKSETRNWRAFKSGDPYKETRKGKLLTADYGNYVKIKGDIEGETVYEISSHHKTSTLVVEIGQEVKPGQVIAEIGNTGNSTGPHEHKEFRNVNNQTIEVEFVEEQVLEPQPPTDKKQQIIDVYLGARPNLTPSDDEINARLQQNKNTVEMIRDILSGDGNAREYWLEEWNIDQTDTDWRQTAEQYKQTYDDLKAILGMSPAENTEDVHGRVKGLLKRVQELEKELEPKVIYRCEGKDFEKLFSFMNLTIIQEKG